MLALALDALLSVWRWSKRNAALVSIVLALATIISIAVGVIDHECRECGWEKADYPLADLVTLVGYETAQILVLNMSPRTGSNLWVAFGRTTAVLLTAFLGIQAVGRLLRESGQNLRLRIWSWRGGHHIVCGLGRVGWPIVQQLLIKRRRVLVLERDPDNELIDDARKGGAIVFVADATDEANFELAHLASARAAYLVTGSDEENIEAAVDVRTVFDRAGRTPPNFACYVHIVDPALGDVLGTSLRANAVDFRVQTFNVTRNTARQLIVKELTVIRPSGPGEVALYVLVGFGAMGQTLATHLAELAHFENCKRCRIVILADDPQASADAFLARWGQFTALAPGRTVVKDWADIRFDAAADEWGSQTFRPADAYRVEHPTAVEYACNAVFAPYPKSVMDRGFLAALARLVREPGVKPAVLFCHPQDQESYSTAVNFEKHFHTAHGAPVPPLFVWLPRQEPLKKLLLGQDSRAAKAIPIRPFGSCADELKLRKLDEPLEDRIGQVIWAGYRKSGAPLTAEDLRAAEIAWSADSEMNLNSNRMAAIHFEVKLACLGLEIVPRDEPGVAVAHLPPDKELALARMEHNRWMAERLLAGVSHGPRTVSDIPPRHPQLCDWDELNSDEAMKKEPAKDFQQIATVFANLNAIGYKARTIPPRQA